MPPVTIYTTRFCPYCTAAKTLLTKKQVSFDEIDVTGDTEAVQRFRELIGTMATVVQPV